MRNKAAVLLLAFALACQPVLAESLTVAEEERQAPGMTETRPAPAATAKPASTPAPKPTVKPAAEPVKAATIPQAAELGAVLSKIDAVTNAVEQARSKGDALDAEIKALREDLKGVEERSLEIKDIVRDVDVFKERIAEMEQQYTRSKQDMEKYLGDLEQLKNSLKSGMDRQEGINDILEVLKKEINNNELELAKIKKTINDVKGKYGNEDNFMTELLKWPYLGITALGLSIIAVGVAVAK